MTQSLGVLERVPLRKIWKKEPEFSAWLAKDEKIILLGEKIGISILSEETEAGVGDFSADILAKEDGGERRVIIENQFGDTDHDHLGKLITYASGRDAKVLIWIAERGRDEHRAAVQWLNANTTRDIGIFLIQIEVLRIGDSAPAPSFIVLEAPNDWIKSTRQNATPSERNRLQEAFWNKFMDYAMQRADFREYFNRLKGQAQHWLNLPIGSSQYHIALNIKKTSVSAEVYIDDNKELYQRFATHRAEIEQELGFTLDWQPLPEKKACRMEVQCSGDFADLRNAENYFSWYCDTAIAMKKVFPKYEK